MGSKSLSPGRVPREMALSMKGSRGHLTDCWMHVACDDGRTGVYCDVLNWMLSW